MRSSRPRHNEPQLTSRRRFLRASAATATSVAISSSAAAKLRDLDGPVRIGLITDLHQDVMHDGPRRLDDFLTAMKKQPIDAVIQMGDFAVPAEKNRPLVDRFNQSHPRALHVLGNHDTDGGYSTQQVLDFWKMKARYYSQDLGGVRLVVLDGNERPSKLTTKYPAHIGSQQLQWLRGELQSHEGPIVVFSHQPLAGAWAVDNAEQVQSELNAAADKIVLALNGHSHIDDLVHIDNVKYLHVNSASYVWVGENYRHENYAKEIVAAYPRLALTCPYREALYAVMTLQPESGDLTIEGCESDWVGKSPAQLGRVKHPDLTDGKQIAPRIRSRRIERSAV